MFWEYKIVTIDYVDSMWIERELNLLGDDGWELVALDKRHYYFKRPNFSDEVNKLKVIE